MLYDVTGRDVMNDTAADRRYNRRHTTRHITGQTARRKVRYSELAIALYDSRQSQR